MQPLGNAAALPYMFGKKSQHCNHASGVDGMCISATLQETNAAKKRSCVCLCIVDAVALPADIVTGLLLLSLLGLALLLMQLLLVLLFVLLLPVFLLVVLVVLMALVLLIGIGVAAAVAAGLAALATIVGMSAGVVVICVFLVVEN